MNSDNKMRLNSCAEICLFIMQWASCFAPGLSLQDETDISPFCFQADPPDPSKIREEDIIGVTVLLLTCSYMGQEFIRVGYYVNNDYDDEQLREEPPAKLLIDRVQRNILTDKPRVTKFPINFHPETSAGQQQEQPQSALPENNGGEGGKPSTDA
jgi:histone chaperone ASF1